MAILKRTKTKAPSAPTNGSTAAETPAGEKSNGGPWAWELTVTAVNDLFLDSGVGHGRQRARPEEP